MHLFGKREAAQDAGHDIRQRVYRRPAALTLTEREIGAFRRLDTFEVRHLDAVLLGEAERCLRGLAIRSRRGADWRSVDELFEIRLPLRHPCNTDSEAPGRGIPFRPHARAQSVGLQLRVGHFGELPRQRRQPARRQLFEAEFDQEFAIHSGYRLLAPGYGPRLAASRIRPAACSLTPAAYVVVSTGARPSTYAFAIATAS